MINSELASLLVDASYISQAEDSRQTSIRRTNVLVQQRRMPERGWSDLSIERLLIELASMDSNNHEHNVGAGEREGRVFSALVRRRHWNMAHGIGRSGDVGAIQPKAAGSSLLCRITEGLVRHALALSQYRGYAPSIPRPTITLSSSTSSSSTSTTSSTTSSTSTSSTRPCKLYPLVLPTATGMTITLTLLALRGIHGHGKTLVAWPRIDQKTCLKAILAAGLTPLVLENVLEGDELRTDLAALEGALERRRDELLCVISTTSCFAPRGADRVVEIAQLCARFGVAHLVNNAYGLQSARLGELLSSAMRGGGRLDAFVQSTDKNFMVPVGGAVVVSASKPLVDAVSRVYPGRASASPVVDLLVTLLAMGAEGYQRLLGERKQLFARLRAGLAEVAARHGERLLHTPSNPISMAMTLRHFAALPGGVGQLGAMLYRRSCSGHRVVDPAKQGAVDAIAFTGYGAHHPDYPVPYLTAACAIGMTTEEIDVFIERLDRTLTEAKQLIPSNNE